MVLALARQNWVCSVKTIYGNRVINQLHSLWLLAQPVFCLPGFGHLKCHLVRDKDLMRILPTLMISI